MSEQFEHSTFHDDLIGKHITVKNWDGCGRDIRGFVTDTRQTGAYTMVSIHPENEWDNDIFGYWISICACEIIDCNHPEKYIQEDYRADCISDPPAQIGWEEFLVCGLCGKEVPYPHRETGEVLDEIPF